MKNVIPNIPDEDALQEALKSFYRLQIKETGGSEDIELAQEKWRTSCFTSGLRYSRYICEDYFDIKGKVVLDLASAWGGHALAFAARGANVIASDIKDHRFASLQKFAVQRRLSVSCLCADCGKLPFGDSSFDVILALDLIEHIDSVFMFADEVKRLLRPGGICLLTTPSRLRSLIEGEPHWGLRGITIMPLNWQAIVAREIFRRDYPYPIIRQYIIDSQPLSPFKLIGLKGSSFVKGRLFRYLQNIPILHLVARKLFWHFLVVHKPYAEDHNMNRKNSDTVQGTKGMRLLHDTV